MLAKKLNASIDNNIRVVKSLNTKWKCKLLKTRTFSWNSFVFYTTLNIFPQFSLKYIAADMFPYLNPQILPQFYYWVWLRYQYWNIAISSTFLWVPLFLLPSQKTLLKICFQYYLITKTPHRGDVTKGYVTKKV